MFNSSERISRLSVQDGKVLFILFIFNLKHLSIHATLAYVSALFGPSMPPHLMIRKDGIHDLQLSQIPESDL